MFVLILAHIHFVPGNFKKSQASQFIKVRL